MAAASVKGKSGGVAREDVEPHRTHAVPAGFLGGEGEHGTDQASTASLHSYGEQVDDSHLVGQGIGRPRRMLVAGNPRHDLLAPKLPVGLLEGIRELPDLSRHRAVGQPDCAHVEAELLAGDGNGHGTAQQIGGRDSRGNGNEQD